MQLALQTFLKFDLRAARIVILLLALISLLLRAASEPLSDAFSRSGSLIQTTTEAGSNAAVAGAEGVPAVDRPEHLGPSTTTAEPSLNTISRVQDYAPPVCQASQLFQPFVTPAADCCPADSAIESALGKQPKASIPSLHHNCRFSALTQQ